MQDAYKLLEDIAELSGTLDKLKRIEPEARQRELEEVKKKLVR